MNISNAYIIEKDGESLSGLNGIRIFQFHADAELAIKREDIRGATIVPVMVCAPGFDWGRVFTLKVLLPLCVIIIGLSMYVSILVGE